MPQPDRRRSSARSCASNLEAAGALLAGEGVSITTKLARNSSGRSLRESPKHNDSSSFSPLHLRTVSTLRADQIVPHLGDALGGSALGSVLDVTKRVDDVLDGDAKSEHKQTAPHTPATASIRRWQRAARKIAVVGKLTARDRWVAKHGTQAIQPNKRTFWTPALATKLGVVVRMRGQGPTRKVMRQRYKESFGAMGATMQQADSIRTLLQLSKHHAGGQEPSSEDVLATAAKDPYVWTEQIAAPGSASRVGSRDVPAPIGDTAVKRNGGRALKGSDASASCTVTVGGGQDAATQHTPTATTVAPAKAELAAQQAFSPVEAHSPRCGQVCFNKFAYKVEELLTSSIGKAVALWLFAGLQVVLGAALLAATKQNRDLSEGSPSWTQSLWESWTYVAGMAGSVLRLVAASQL